MTAPDDAYVKQRWVFCGRRTGTTGKMHDEFRPIIPDGYGQALWFEAKQTEALRVVGGIYELLATEDYKSARLKGGAGQFVGKVTDGGKILEWQAAHDRAMLERTSIKMEKQAKNAHLDALADLRALYRKSSPQERLQLEVVVLSYLRRGEWS